MYSIQPAGQLALALATCFFSQQGVSAAQGSVPFAEWTVPIAQTGQPTAAFTPERRVALPRPSGGCTVVGRFSLNVVTMVGLDASGSEVFRVNAPANTQMNNSQESFVGGLADGSVIIVEKSLNRILINRWDEMGTQLPTVEVLPPQGDIIDVTANEFWGRGRYVGLMADGGLTVTGVTTSQSNPTVTSAWRFEQNGQLRHTTRIPEPVGTSYMTSPHVPLTMGDDVIVSTIGIASLGRDILLAKIGPLGTVLWQQQMVSAHRGVGGAVPAVNGAGEVAVGGNVSGAKIFRFNPQGQVLGLPVSGPDVRPDVSLKDDGTFTSGSYGRGSANLYLAGFDAQGNLSWASPSNADRIWVGPTVGGSELLFELNPQRGLLALNADGSEKWRFDTTGYLPPNRWTDVFPDEALYLLSEPPAGGGVMVMKVNTGADVSTSACTPGTLNSVGSIGRLSCVGSTNALGNDLVLLAQDLPPSAFCLFLASAFPLTSPMPIPSSVGSLCLGAPLARFVAPGQVKTADPGGMVPLRLDLGTLPLGSGTVAVMPGDTWSFQAWYRDGGNLSNLTETATVAF